MKCFVNKKMIAFIVFFPISTFSASASNTLPLTLIGRSNGDKYFVELDKADWRWLHSKEELRMGVSAPDYPPLNMTVNDKSYEGVTADYIKLIGDILHVKVKVYRYASRIEAIEALKDGDLDLLGAANDIVADDPQLLAKGYMKDRPILATRSNNGETMPFDLAGKRLVLLDGYLPQATVKTFYPKAEVNLYPTAVEALGAVAFGQADVYLGDSINTNFLANSNFLDDIDITDYSRLEAREFAFVLKREDQQLQRIIDNALAAIPNSERVAILRRWNGGILLSNAKRLNLSSNEKRWIERHHSLKVAVLDSISSLSFFDENGVFRGLSADILAKVGTKAGLQFDFVRSSDVDDMIDHVTRADADLMMSIKGVSPRLNEVRTTRPYLSSPLVLVVPSPPGSPDTMEGLAGKSIALISGSPDFDFIQTRYPKISIKTVDSLVQAVAMVAEGKANAAMINLLSAQQLVTTEYRNSLRLGSIVSPLQRVFGFAVHQDAIELFSIIEKALISIPPEEISELSNRWRNNVVIRESEWQQYPIILLGGIIAVLIILTAIIWIAYLGRLTSRRENAKYTLNNQVELLRILFADSPSPIYILDREGRMIMCNTRYLEVMNNTLEQAMTTRRIGSDPDWDPVHADAYHEAHLEVLEQGIPCARDRKLITPHGKVMTIYHWILPYKSFDGEVIGTFAGWLDVSERHLLLEELQSAKKESDEASRAKSYFLSTMSHEIRTPMNAVIGMLELAMKKANQGVIDRFSIEVASAAARDLLELIGDILDIARIESGRMVLTPERANVRVLVESVVRVFESVAREKHLQLRLNYDMDSNSDVLIDPLRFKQILSNLLSNAIKFTDKGEIHLNVTASSIMSGERLAVLLEVVDTGIGISEEDLEKLFKPFSQVNNNNKSASRGSGLGLVISRTLCEMMHGTLRMNSVSGKGTKVVVSIDLLTLADSLPSLALNSESACQAQVLNILVVDDYPANRLLLSQQLSYLGHRVADAEDGAHGLREWRNGSFDMIITDCSMPIMSGYDLARAVRAEERAGDATPCLILGFTANAQSEEIQRCLEAGMNDCLFKPISLNDLSIHLASVKPRTNLQRERESLPCNESYIDLASLRQLTRGDQTIINNLLFDLASSNEEDMCRLTALFTAHDLRAISDLTHRVKGGARILKAQDLIYCCEQVEFACKSPDEQLLLHSVEALQLAMEKLAGQLALHMVSAPEAAPNS